MRKFWQDVAVSLVVVGLYIVIALFLSSCGNGVIADQHPKQLEGKVFPGNRGRTTIVFADDFPDPDRTEFMIGLTYWNCVGVDSGLEPGGDRLEIKRSEPNIQFYGYYSSDGRGNDFIAIDLTKAPLVDRINRIAVAAHEFGHAINQRHLDPNDDHSVMNFLVPGVKHLSRLDVAQFDRVWGEDHSGYDCPDTEGAF